MNLTVQPSPPERSATVSTSSSASSEDAAIVAAAARGDHESALHLLVSAHAEPLGKTCMALLGSASEAETVVRDALQGALAELVGHRGGSTLRARIWGLARRLSAQRLERRDRQELSTTEISELTPAQRARTRLAALKPTEREALVLRFEAELSLREVAEACGIDEETARQRISRGLSRLAHSMTEEQS